MTDTPRRGRPKGATRYATTDEDILEKIAELITDAKPAVTPTLAMRKLGHNDPSAIRRLQRKWRTCSAELQNKVRDRRRAATSVTPQGSTTYSYSVSNGLNPPYGLGAISHLQAEIERQQRFQDMIDPPYLRRMREEQERQQRFQDMIDPPASRAMRKMMEQQRQIEDLINPPHLRALGLFR